MCHDLPIIYLSMSLCPHLDTGVNVTKILGLTSSADIQGEHITSLTIYQPSYGTPCTATVKDL